MVLFWLLFPIVVLTVLAALTRFCLLGYEVCYPLVNNSFDEDTKQIHATLRNVESVSKGCLTDRYKDAVDVCADAGTCSLDGSRREPFNALLGQLHITIIAATEQSPLTNYQLHVLERYRYYVMKSFSQLRRLGIDVRIRFSTQYYTGLNKHYQWFHQPLVEDKQAYPYILQENLLNEDIFSDRAGYASTCTAGNNCKAVTLIWYLPDLVDAEHNHSARKAESKMDSMNVTRAMRVVRSESDIFAHSSADYADNNGDTASGIILPNQRCFTVLDLQNKDNYDVADADMIYSALQLSIQCIRDAVGVSSVSTTPQDTNAAGLGTANELRTALSVSSAEWALFMWNRMEAMHSISLQKLRMLIQLYKYRDSWWRLFAMNSRLRTAFRQIMRQLCEISELMTVLSQTDSVVTVGDVSSIPQSERCVSFLQQFEDQSGHQTEKEGTSMARLERMLRSTYELILQLEYEPGGNLREATSLEQYFAIFGPYWLPLLVPAYRAVHSAFV